MIAQQLHELKTWPVYFTQLLSEKKMFELRKRDRDFRMGNYLLLREWHPTGKAYTKRAVLVQIVSILDANPKMGLARGYCILGIRLIAETVWPR